MGQHSEFGPHRVEQIHPSVFPLLMPLFGHLHVLFKHTVEALSGFRVKMRGVLSGFPAGKTWKLQKETALYWL